VTSYKVDHLFERMVNDVRIWTLKSTSLL